MGLFDKKNQEDKTEEAAGDQGDKKVGMKDLYSAKEKDKEKTSSVGNRRNSSAYKILVKPLVTEKATILGQENKYVFEVSLSSNKIEVAKAIKSVYGVDPVKVNIMRKTGKKVKHGKVSGKKKNWKKALVTLPKGKTIKIYEGV